MKDFPSEYTYIDEHGQVWYKTYQMKKVEVEDLNPYILSGLPVVINPETTVETLFDTINKYALLKVNCITFDSFYKELKSKSEEPEEGYLVFSRGRYGGTFVIDIPEIESQTFKWLAVNPQYAKMYEEANN